MKKAITDKLRVASAKSFKDSFADTVNYLFSGHANEWDDESEADDVVITDLGQRAIGNDILFGKRIRIENLDLMAPRYNWTSGTVYDKYDDSLDMTGKKYYVVVDEGNFFSVFKCIDNANGSESVAEPTFTETGADDNYYRTSDGYVWKYLYQIDAGSFAEKATQDYIPVRTDLDVSANAIPGSISTIHVQDTGMFYDNYAKGTFDRIGIGNSLQTISITGQEYDQYDVVVTDANNFVTGAISSNTASGVVLDVDTATNSLYVSKATGAFTVGETVSNGNTTANVVSVSVRAKNLPAVEDFYVGSSVYVTSGVASGQIRDIVEYTIVGSERRIRIDSPFYPSPESGDGFEIAPTVTITGDGLGARAIATINTTTNSISTVEMLDIGNSYTTATATISTNAISPTQNAAIRAVLCSTGGHGSDPENELKAYTVGIAASFDGSEYDEITTSNAYRTTGILRNPRFKTATLSVSNTANVEVGHHVVTSTANGDVYSVAENDPLEIVVKDVLGVFEWDSELTIYTDNTCLEVVSTTTLEKSTPLYETFQNLIGLVTASNNDVLSSGEYVTQASTGSSGYVHSVIDNLDATSTYCLNNVTGSFQATDANTGISGMVSGANGGVIEVTAVMPGHIYDNSGEILFVENSLAVDRSANHKEKYNILIGF